MSRRQRGQATLYCPVCNAQGLKQPVLTQLVLDYRPAGGSGYAVPTSVPSGGYHGQGAGPEFRYVCPRDNYTEIWIEMPRERDK